MQIEIGKIYEGTVRNITKYGAFVDITNPEKQRIMGMVHISEISHSYVNEISDFVSEGQSVNVKVLSVGDNGKISLSIKQAEPAPQKPQRSAAPRRDGNGGGNEHREPREPREHREPRERDARPNVWEPKKKAPQNELTFEDMLSRFKQNSEERMCDIKRNTERKNHSRRK